MEEINYENKVQLWFYENQTEVRAAHFVDDYEGWYDGDAGIFGSSLADANDHLNHAEFNDFLKSYLENIDDYIGEVECNNPLTGRMYLDRLGLKLPAVWLVSDVNIDGIKRRAAEEFAFEDDFEEAAQALERARGNDID